MEIRSEVVSVLDQLQILKWRIHWLSLLIFSPGALSELDSMTALGSITSIKDCFEFSIDDDHVDADADAVALAASLVDFVPRQLAA